MRSAKDQERRKPIAAMFAGHRPQPPSSSIPSSSPAFGTPIHPLRPFGGVPVLAPGGGHNKPAVVLPILLPPATLRPLAFRTFTKKHSLNLTSSALQELATFIGRHCGSGWREEGLADRVLEDVARAWKARNGGVLVEGTSKEFVDILKTLEGNMSGGKVMSAGGGAGGGRSGSGLARQASFMTADSGQDMDLMRKGLRPTVPLLRQDSGTGFGMSGLDVEDDVADDDLGDVRRWLKVIGGFEQPRMVYNVSKKHFERDASKPSLMPPASHKTLVFRNRYDVIHQRLLRSDLFQTSAVVTARGSTRSSKRGSLADPGQQGLKLTQIANLLGRHGSHHMVLGMLTILPATGGLAISDPHGTIALDVSRATAMPDPDSTWFCPGMIVLVDGVYEEDDDGSGRGLSGTKGIGGVLGGRFQAFYIGQPPCERRQVTLGTKAEEDAHAVGGGFGWIDFLGVGSERAVGSRMRKLEQRLHNHNHNHNHNHSHGHGRNRVVIMGELNVDNPRVLQALRKILSLYASEQQAVESTGSTTMTTTPLCFVLMGNFTTHAVLARGGSAGSIEYKEAFDGLASTLAEFPALLRTATFVFVPGDNDGWVSAFTSGAATPLPRKAVPDMFTSRIRRTFAAANAEGVRKGDGGGEAIWTTNPARMSLFGPAHEIVLFRDDVSARLRRTAVRLKRGRKGNDAREDEVEDEDTEMHQDTHEQDTQGTQKSPSKTTTARDHDDSGGGTMDLDAQDGGSSGGVAAPTSKESNLSHDTRASRRLVTTLLDQGYLAPFRQTTRPVHWDFAGAMHLYPLPTAVVLADTTAPAFCLSYEGCHAMNPGAVLVAGRRGVGRWVEWVVGGTGVVRECTF